MSYHLEPLTPDEAARWDALIALYESRELFHRRVWLDYLAASRGIDIHLWAIRDGSHTVGYFCGGILQKGPFRILGSPLRGWGTNFMGPVANTDINQIDLLKALDCIAHDKHLAMTELESRIVSERAMVASHYEVDPGWTYFVTLTPENPDLMWRALDSTCRNRIRKAIKAGLTVEDTDDPRVADEFYDQYYNLMQKKGLVPSYPREYPRLLFRYLKKEDLLFALRVRDCTGRIIATGLFPHDDHTIYFWGGASQQDGRELCPNEYLHWKAMCLAADRDLRSYDMCGFGRFKKKFGGALMPIKRWHKCHSRVVRWARSGYEVYMQRWIRLQGWWQAMRNRAL